MNRLMLVVQAVLVLIFTPITFLYIIGPGCITQFAIAKWGGQFLNDIWVIPFLAAIILSWLTPYRYPVIAAWDLALNKILK